MKVKTLIILLATISTLGLVGCGKSAKDAAGKAAADSTVKDAGLNSTVFVKIASKLESTCAKNGHGLTETECINRIEERKVQCADLVGQKHPGALDSYDRLKQATQTFSNCIFSN